MLGRGQGGFRERVALCTTRYDLDRLAGDVVGDHGYAYFSMVRLPSSKDSRLTDVAAINNWPDDLVAAYDSGGLLKTSPIFNTLKRSARPCLWSYRSNARHCICGRDPRGDELFRDFGLWDGFHVSLQEPSGQRGVMGFAGERPVPDERELAELNYFATLVYDRFWELKKGARGDEADKLSQREAECLVWTAAGKTSAEIAIILELSEHTVNHYLTAACQKLGATNRAHAVYKAVRQGMID